jgi:predicted nucleotidyltransferase
MLQKLNKLSPKQIAKTIKQDFLQNNLFRHFPETKDKVSVALIGSISYGLYDDKSDIDISIIFPESLQTEYRDKLKSFKAEFKQYDRQIQIFYNTNFEQLQQLTSWQDDLKIREFAGGIILHDPNKVLTKIQRQISWYPTKIYKEKINWLFAEAVFELMDRYKTATKRKDVFYGSVSKLKFLQLIMTMMLMVNKNYPIYEKHLYRLQSKQKVLPKGYLSSLKRIMTEQDLAKSYVLMDKLLHTSEALLVAKRLIPKKDEPYWIDARPGSKVKLQR